MLLEGSRAVSRDSLDLRNRRAWQVIAEEMLGPASALRYDSLPSGTDFAASLTGCTIDEEWSYVDGSQWQRRYFC